ncbi:hypothetical protein NDU88_005705 [Pleurodeles waltl]|uniref:Uncharacterized protein n=1 Tax=Pleurodeles waltl TaxID=8319 RepID=A0AAV7TUR5_PLEWA|nr:hypothetical protein NDU88_005705 [Pleurodeles waltl]
MEPLQEDRLDIILREKKDFQAVVGQKLGAITTEINLNRDDHRKLAEKVKTTETLRATLVPGQEDLAAAVTQR